MNDIRNRIQFVTAVALFFPVILNSLFKLSLNDEVSNSVILGWGMVVAILLIVYVLTELVKSKLEWAWVMRRVRVLLLAEVALFVPVLYALASLQTGEVSLSTLFLYGVSSWLVVLVPISIVCLFVINLAYISWKGITAKKS
jgi:hypothetical protein